MPQLVKQRRFACEYEEDLAECAPLITLLAENGGMSGDESDNNHDGSYTGNTKYFRIRPAWRAPAVSTWLDIIDKVYVASRFQDDRRATAGNWIRKRHNTNRVDERAKAVVGLPENFYEQSWLDRQTPRTVQKLKMRRSISMDHTDHIMRYESPLVAVPGHSLGNFRIAHRFSNVENRSDRPRRRNDSL